MDRFKLIKNPPSNKKKVPIQSQSVWTCKMCKKNPSKYTCPRCNLPYCSMICYKSETHGGCSESFYKECVMEDLKNRKAGDDVKQKMMTTLEKLHEECKEEPDVLDLWKGDEEPEIPSLDERLRGLDLDEDEEKIWDKLTEEEKRDFELFVTNKNLSEVIEIWVPWWTTELIRSKIIDLDDPSSEDFPDRPDIPVIIDAPDLHELFLRKPPADAVSHSLVNLLYAYVLLTRLYNGDHLSCAELSAENLLEISCGLRGDRVLHSAEEAVIAVAIDVDKSSIASLLESRDLRSSSMLDLINILQESVFTKAALSDVHIVLKKAAKIPHLRKELVNGFKKVEYFLAFVEEYGVKLNEVIGNVYAQHVAYVQESMEHDAVETASEGFQQRKPKIEELVD